MGAATLGPSHSCRYRFEYFTPEELRAAASAAEGAAARAEARVRLQAGLPALADASAQVGIVTGGSDGGGGWLLWPAKGMAGLEKEEVQPLSQFNSAAAQSPPPMTARAVAAAAQRMELLGAELAALAVQFRAELHLGDAVKVTPSPPPSSQVAALGSPTPLPVLEPPSPPPTPLSGGSPSWGLPAAAELARWRFERAPRGSMVKKA